MRKKIAICVYIFILVFLIGILSGCKSEEERMNEEGSLNLSTSFKQFQELSEEIVFTTMYKDWPKSLKNVNSLQTIWTDLYIELKKQGVSEMDVNAFVKDLNILYDHLISKTLNIPQKPLEEPQEEEKKEQVHEQQKALQSNENTQKSQDESSNKNTEKEENEQNDIQQQKLANFQQQDHDPKEVLDEIDPILSATKEDLTIVNSAVKVTQHIPKFMLLFKSPVPPDMYKLKYLVRHLDVSSKLMRWNVVSTDLNSILATWSSLQSSAVEADPDIKIQLDQSIDELKDVVTSKNINLTGIKSNIIIKQMENLITKTEINKKKENQK